MRHLLPKLSLAILALIASEFGCAAGRTAGQPCAETADCRDTLLCFDGECTPPGSCPTHVPVSCGDGSCCPPALVCCGDGLCYVSTAECKAATCVEAGKSCESSSDCCSSLTCQAGVCKTPASACANRSCFTSTSCCTGYTCSRFGKLCQAAMNLDLGEPCTGDGQCKSKICRSYCTTGCLADADCTDVTSCLDSALGFICIPFCTSSADCTVFGAGIFCQTGTEPSGFMSKGCFGRP